MVKQLHGKQISYNNILDLDSARAHGARLRGPGVRDRQAQQPVRRRASARPRSTPTARRSRATRSAPSAASSRSTGAVDKRHRRAPARAVHRGADRARLRRRRARRPDAEAEHPHPRGPGAPPAGARRARDPPGRRRPARPGPRRRLATTASRWRSSPSASRPRRSGRDLLFAWRVCRHVKSNAIVLARGLATIGIGAGQMSRVDSVRLAVEKAATSMRSRAPCWRPTRSSRSPTGPSWRSRPA